jgi:hypothetical protein
VEAIAKTPNQSIAEKAEIGERAGLSAGRPGGAWRAMLFGSKAAVSPVRRAGDDFFHLRYPYGFKALLRKQWRVVSGRCAYAQGKRVARKWAKILLYLIVFKAFPNFLRISLDKGGTYVV